MNVEAFERHYRAVHIPLAMRLPGLRRYTLSRNARAVRGGSPSYPVAELDWDAALREAFESALGLSTANDVVRLVGGGVRSMVFELEDVVLEVPCSVFESSQ